MRCTCMRGGGMFLHILNRSITEQGNFVPTMHLLVSRHVHKIAKSDY